MRCTALLTILTLLGLATTAGAEEEPIHEEGTLAGADYRILIPENWNGGLVLYAHGYVEEYIKPKFSNGMVAAAGRMGYALAESKYSRQGYALREGVLETDALRSHFETKYQETWPTIIAGESMGGMITLAMIERFPEVYDGALAMCTPTDGALEVFKRESFDVLLLFERYFPGLSGSVVAFPHGRDTFDVISKEVRALIAADPERAKAFINLAVIPSVDDLPDIMGFNAEILRDFYERLGGNAFDNRNTMYVGLRGDDTINQEIARFEAEPVAEEFLIKWSTPTGVISDPVVLLQNTVDPLVTSESKRRYEWLTTLAGTSELFLPLWVHRVGHCAFNDDEGTEALKRLDHWIRRGTRPQGGEITLAQETK